MGFGLQFCSTEVKINNELLSVFSYYEYFWTMWSLAFQSSHAIELILQDSPMFPRPWGWDSKCWMNCMSHAPIWHLAETINGNLERALVCNNKCRDLSKCWKKWVCSSCWRISITLPILNTVRNSNGNLHVSIFVCSFMLYIQTIDASRQISI